MIISSWTMSTTLAADPKYKNFRVAVYALQGTVRQWSNPAALAAAYENMDRQVKFDKVYLEVAGGESMVDENTLDPIKKFFTDRGIIVSCSAAFNGRSGGTGTGPNGGSLSMAVPADREYLQRAIEMCARHFDEIILDDWFFLASKTPADIAAKGDKSWTQYRLEAMDEAAVSLLIKPAKAVNPKFRLIIKFPNWYEHYQAMGYDLDAEPILFDSIYTGVETRDPVFTEQHLQQYESYDILRYLENVKPGGNDGGWVDTLQTKYIDRYAEQIWDMGFAKPREITLWNWGDEASGVNVGTRPWQEQETSFNLQKAIAGLPTAPADQIPPAGRGRGGSGNGLTNGRVAGIALLQLDSFLDKLGKPIGIAGYRPPHSIGDEFYYDYLGMCGIPIDLHSTFPTDANVVLLTAGAANDPDIVAKIKGQLGAGKNVVITSGLLRALSDKGIKDISEFEYTDQKVAVTDFLGRNGVSVAGAASLDDPIIFPIIHFITNQSWGQLNGYSAKSPENAYPIVLSDAYDKGFLYVLDMPDNVADLYRLPAPVLNAIRSQIMGAFPVRLADAPGQVSLFAYDNNGFIVQSFLPTATTVTVSVAGNPRSITDLLSGEAISPSAAPPVGGRGGGGRGRGGGAARGVSFSMTIPPHSYRAFLPGN
jgi:hypothetical protein